MIIEGILPLLFNCVREPTILCVPVPLKTNEVALALPVVISPGAGSIIMISLLTFTVPKDNIAPVVVLAVIISFSTVISAPVKL